MPALAASEADVANIRPGMFEEGVRVHFDLLEPDDAALVADVADEHGFEEVDAETYEYRIDFL